MGNKMQDVEMSSEVREANIRKANKSGFITKKASMFIYPVVLILAVAARTIQLFSNMNFTTNRYIDPSPLKNYPMMVLIPGFILLAVVLLAGSSKDKVLGPCILINPMRLRYDRLNKKIPHAAAYMSVLMAFLILTEIVMQFIEIVHKNEEIVKTLTPDEAEYYSMLTGYSGGLFVIQLFMFFSALTFVSIAVNVFKGEGFSHANCAALSIYCIWKCINIAMMVEENSIVSCSSECVYTMFAYMTAVLFFLNTARFFNGMEKKSTRFWMCFMGYVSSILAAVSVLPRYILLLIPTNYEERLDMNVPAISDIGIVFMTITLVAVFWSTYVYRVMPKLNLGKRRWSKAPISKEYMQIETIEVKEVGNELDR